jgi:hypothetical protein
MVKREEIFTDEKYQFRRLAPTPFVEQIAISARSVNIERLHCRASSSYCGDRALLVCDGLSRAHRKPRAQRVLQDRLRR